jgi:hypothetical protein
MLKVENAPARLFAALGDVTRLGLISHLSDGTAHSIVQLGEGLPITLLGAGLVQRTRSGREALFALRPEAVAEARDWLAQVGSQWEETLGRFKTFVENQP